MNTPTPSIPGVDREALIQAVHRAMTAGGWLSAPRFADAAIAHIAAHHECACDREHADEAERRDPGPAVVTDRDRTPDPIATIKPFRHPWITGDDSCGECGQFFRDHWWADAGDHGHTVCYLPEHADGWVDEDVCREAHAEVERLRAGIEALHFPVEIEPSETICGHCSWQLPNGRFVGQVVEWPCPTTTLTEGENR